MRLIIKRRIAKSEGAEPNEGKLRAAIIAFLKENPEPDDSAIHGLAAALKIDPHEFEEVIYRLLAKKLTKAEQLGLFDRPAAPKPAEPPKGKPLSGRDEGLVQYRVGSPKQSGESIPPPAAQQHAPAKAAWESIPNTMHAGGQRRRVGDHYEYRYPDGAGGWANSPPKAAPKKKEAKEKATPEKASAKKEPESEPEGYATTGYVFGSRKELWALRNSGELEKDPAQAYKVVTRDAVVGGKIVPESFAAERKAGTTPAAAWAKYKLLSSIQQRPPDSPEMRAAFIEATGVLQNSLAQCRTVDDVELVLADIDHLLEGRVPAEELTADEMRARGYGALIDPRPKFGTPEYDKWSKEHSAANQKMLKDNRGLAYYAEVEDGKYRIYGHAAMGASPAMHLQVIALGPRFAGILGRSIDKDGKRLRYSRSGDTRAKFRQGMRQLEAMPADDAWTKLVGEKKGRPTDAEVSREAKGEGPDYFTILRQARAGAAIRKGGRELPEGISPKGMAADLGLKVVEFGEWVQGEKEGTERKFHTEACHAALHDLADVLGIDPKQVGMNQQLSVAFGSRGAGKHSGAAQYFPDTRVINLTRVWGKGGLAHEWGHAMDHMIQKAYNPAVGKATYPSDSAALPYPKRKEELGNIPKPIQDAMADVMEQIMWTDRASSDIKAAANAEISKLKEQYYRERDPEAREEVRLRVNAAVKDHNRQAREGAFKEPTPFHAAAMAMGAYWSRPVELFARCFETYIQGRLKKRGMVNTYLVEAANHDEQYPGFYPRADHQAKIDVAMQKLVDVLKKSESFQKAMRAHWNVWLKSLTNGPPLVIR